MLTNELLFICYIVLVSGTALGALRIGKEALIALICLLCVLVNLFVTKEITLFGLTATASDALGVGAALSLNLLQEYYGKSIAQKTIWISFLCTLFYVAASLIHIAYIPSATDISQIHFVALLTPMARIVIASLSVYLVTQNLDCHLYGYFCNITKDRHFILRNYSSIAITQFVDTVLFSFLGLYKLNESFSSVSNIIDIIVISYAIKLAVLCIATPFLALSKKFIHKPQ